MSDSIDLGHADVCYLGAESHDDLNILDDILLVNVSLWEKEMYIKRQEDGGDYFYDVGVFDDSDNSLKTELGIDTTAFALKMLWRDGDDGEMLARGMALTESVHANGDDKYTK